jgi:hypothetical protein
MLGLALRTPRAPLRPPDVRSPWDYRRRNVTTPSDEREMPRSGESGRTISNDEGIPVNRRCRRHLNERIQSRAYGTLGAKNRTFLDDYRGNNARLVPGDAGRCAINTLGIGRCKSVTQ